MVQKLVPQLPTLNNLLDILIARCILVNHIMCAFNEFFTVLLLLCGDDFYHLIAIIVTLFQYDRSMIFVRLTIASISDCLASHSCSIDKSYLVDVVTKLYIATDSNPVDVRTYELCSDLVDVRTHLDLIYIFKFLHISFMHNTLLCPFVLFDY